MRVRNSIYNIYISVITQVVIVALGFLSRNVFISSLGTEYLGINGLLTNVLSMLSLVEGGIGTSIVFNLYKPLAEGDTPKIIALVQLYKKLYSYLAIIVFIIGMLIYPFVRIFAKEVNEKFLFFVYFIFVIKNVISYLNAHKWSLINADQKGYVLGKYNLLFNVVTTLTRIIILKYTQNYILYLVVELIIIIIQNIWNGSIVNKRYPYIKTSKKYYIEKNTMKNIKKNVKAIFLHNIGSYCVFGTDNLLISALVNLKTVGLYSNYTMIINQLSNLLIQVINGIGAGVGNLMATENDEKTFEIFEVTNFINFCIYSFCTIFLYNLLEPFIDYWLGDGLLLSKVTFIVILLNFYLTGMRKPISIFKEKAGVFSPDKYAPIIESILNLCISIILGKKIGLVGIFLGTTISSISIPIWIQAKLVYNRVFNKSVSLYFKIYFKYLIVTIITCVITTAVCNKINLFYGIINLIIKGVICIIIPGMLYIGMFYKTKEFKYLFTLCKELYKSVKNKMSLNI